MEKSFLKNIRKKKIIPALRTYHCDGEALSLPNLAHVRQKIIARRLAGWKLYLDRDDLPVKNTRPISCRDITTGKRHKSLKDRRQHAETTASIWRAHRRPSAAELAKFEEKVKEYLKQDVLYIILQHAAEHQLGTNDPRSDVAYVRSRDLRKEVFKHSWKSLLFKLADSAYADNRNSTFGYILWNAGTLALMCERPDGLSSIQELSRQLTPILRPYVTRFPVEIGIWMLQAGRFRDSLQLINDSVVDNLQGCKKLTYLQPCFTRSLRKKQFDLIIILFNAVQSYYLWKRESRRGSSRHSRMESGNSYALVSAVTKFQEFVDLASQTGADVTIMIEPYIELLMLVKHKSGVLEIFQQVVKNYPDHFILEQLYLSFLWKHFPSLKEEIGLYEKRRKLYMIKTNTRLPYSAISSWKRKKIRSADSDSVFKRI